MDALDEHTIDLRAARERLVTELREHALVIGEVTLTSGATARVLRRRQARDPAPGGLRGSRDAARGAGRGVGGHGGRRHDDGRGPGRVRGARRRRAREGVLRAQGRQGAWPAAAHRGPVAGAPRTAAWSSRTSSRPAARRSRRSRRCKRRAHDLRRGQRARPARGRRRGDRAGGGRAVPWRSARSTTSTPSAQTGGRLTRVPARGSSRHAAARARGDAARTSRCCSSCSAELAEYEHLEHELRGDRASCSREALFGEHPAAAALIAERGVEVAGYALFFPTFSSFLAIQGVWLEDLFVRPAHRGRASAGRCSRPSPRVCASAAASAWNGRRSTGTSWRSASTAGIGAQTMDEWITHRLVGEALAAARGRSAGRLRGRAPVAFWSPGALAAQRPRSPMDKTTAS